MSYPFGASIKSKQEGIAVLAIKDATIYTIKKGVIPKGTVLVDEGKIVVPQPEVQPVWRCTGLMRWSSRLTTLRPAMISVSMVETPDSMALA